MVWFVDQMFRMLEDALRVNMTLRFVQFLSLVMCFRYSSGNDIHRVYIDADLPLYGAWFPEVKDSFYLGPCCIYIWS